MSEDRSEGFKRLALQKAQKGEETIQSLEQKRGHFANSPHETTQQYCRGIEAALEILKSK